MMTLFARLFGRGNAAFAEARITDTSAIATIHGASFQRGWGEDEIRGLIGERNVVAHRVAVGRKLVGFILSRLAAGEAEILSVAITPAWRGRALARPLLDLHLRRLAGLGVRTVFLEVDNNNAPARALYKHAGFFEVGQRQGYYQSGAAALVLRRDLG
ncbi:MAG TPA: GNAT family N-acetyltransferase [Xanthobacteraceae bacterium]|jgi:ribosomal-protein-alanine N-acetyltransferase|nr:GNAT family N-acetyltransferase [Xanthobacteraceae bacterium]